MYSLSNYYDFVPIIVPKNMNETKLTCKVRMKKDYIRNDGTCALYLVIYADKRKRIPLSIYVKPNEKRKLICYDEGINSKIKSSHNYIYKRPKLKESIISKAFGENNYDTYKLNFGDGDCCFA